MYQLAADLTLIVQFAFIIFVVFGGILFLISTKIIYVHVPALIWGIYIEINHSICPLTHIERWFLNKANLEVYTESFIYNYLSAVVYPINLTNEIQTYIGAVLLIFNLIMYGLILGKLRRQ